ncbi:hypothetical protein [Protaetiibacter mangrovi]|uniref:Uncharacterized protein n=1 Tax=Protaetiibacter mangrovi TaxID=2970926 RepID=A0ABT1ZDE9_9MICO|nr:hypothetical protein [Protaetiibacter mangrovi]MCS0498735.1 hypothetical protein [Protaetiibacter mangrovi]TPX02707.1 hypothetical protein FJ656_20980 [Schumannella luteola]
MTRTDDLMAMMQRHMQGTAFVFSRTAKGFTIDLDLANRQWWPLIAHTNLSETSSFQIITDEIDSTFTIVEIPRHIEWGGDEAPHFVAAPVGGVKQSLKDEVDLRVSAEPIRRFVRREAGGLGFREALDRKKLFTMLGVAAGGVAAVVLVLVIIVNALG